MQRSVASDSEKGDRSVLMSDEEKTPLALPAPRAHMGDWIYYIGFLTMREIAERISIAEDIHSGASLRHLLQRRLTDRSREIKDYLLSQEQRFFNALVIATYGGKPEWNEIVVRNRNREFQASLEPLEGALGILTLAGSEKLFAVDGQHRVAGIKAAVKQRKRMGNEEVCVIIIPGITQEHRSQDPTGFERTRRVFSTLNRYAKPVSKRDIIALDEDDIVAILTRKLVEEHPLFRDKVSPRSGNSLLAGDKTSLTTITAVYDALDIHLPDTRRGWVQFRKLRPPDRELEQYGKKAVRLWDTISRYYPPIREMRKGAPDDQVAAKYRGEHGGHLLFRPVGLLLVIRVLRCLMDAGESLQEAVRRIARVPAELASEPWAGLLWDAGNRRMITAGENQRAARRLLLYLVGGDLTTLKSSPDDLREELAGLFNTPVEEYSLPKRLSST